MINLGDRVIDNVSGFEGTATSRHIYLNGCERITVQPPIDKEGKLPASETFDVPQLTVTKPAAVVIDRSSTDKPGGPQCEPLRPSVPSR